MRSSESFAIGTGDATSGRGDDFRVLVGNGNSGDGGEIHGYCFHGYGICMQWFHSILDYISTQQLLVGNHR